MLSFFCLVSLVLACSLARAASISITPTGELDFTAHSGDTATQTVTITNLTALPLYINIGLTGSGSADFTTNPTGSVQIAGYGTQSIKVNFAPGMGTGYDTATLMVTSSAMDTLRSMLVGHATETTTPNLQITPEGTQVLNAHIGSSATDTIRLRNETNSSLGVTAALSGTSSALFTLSSTSLSLMGDSSGVVRVTFTPLVTGTDTAFLTLRSAMGDTEQLLLIGHAMPAIPFQLRPTGSLVFNTRVGVADTQYVTIHNTTATALTLTGSLSGSSDFTANLVGLTVAPNGTTTIPIVFKSNTAGTFTGKLSVSSLLGDTGSVTLIGHAMMSNEFELSVPDEVDFSTRVGDTECLPIRITNNTMGAITLTQFRIRGDGSNAFTFDGNSSVTVAADSTNTLMVCFAPTTGGEDQLRGTLSFQFAGMTDTTVKGSADIELQGNVQGRENEGDSLFFLVTRELDFDNVIVDSTQCETIQISNPTASAVTIDSAMLTGPNSTMFTITGATMLSVAPHSVQYVDVCFSPTVAMQEQTFTLTLVTTSTLGTNNILVRVVANAIDTINNNGELTNCIFVRHEHGVLGPILSGGTDTSAIYLTNRTNSTVTINSATVSGSGSSAFSVVSTFPMTIQSGAQGQLMVAFNPTVTGTPSFGATIALNATGTGLTCGPITIHVQGVAVPGRLGHGDRDTSDIDLGTELTGNGTSIITITNPKFATESCVNDTITLMNTTASTITINNILIPSNSNLSLVTNMSTPITIGSGQSASIVVEFCGNGTVDQMFQAPLFIATNQSPQPQQFTIQAIDPPAASVAESNPVAINFALLPNPSDGEVLFRIPGAATANVEIYDVLGNLITTMKGTTNLTWNGNGAAGSPVASGQYIVRVTGTDSQGQPYRASRELVIQH